MKTLKELHENINALQQIIDLESEDADLGNTRSRQLVINAEMEIEQNMEKINELAISNCLV
jgi:hypothetical protein